MSDNEKFDELGRKLDTLILLQRVSMMGPERVHRFTAEDRDIAFFLPDAATDRIQSRILLHSEFFEGRQLRELAPFIPAGASVVDAGANIGNHSVFFAKILGAKVTAFEPQRHVFEILKRNIELNLIGAAVEPIRKALGASPGRASLKSVRSSNLGGAQFSFGESGDYEVTTLDSLRLQHLDFIKIDVEGAQMEMLAGGRETLARLKPIIFIELRQKQQEFDAPAALLAEIGFRATQVDANNYLFRAE